MPCLSQQIQLLDLKVFQQRSCNLFVPISVASIKATISFLTLSFRGQIKLSQIMIPLRPMLKPSKTYVRSIAYRIGSGTSLNLSYIMSSLVLSVARGA